jgi:hypothetical protein
VQCRPDPQRSLSVPVPVPVPIHLPLPLRLLSSLFAPYHFHFGAPPLHRTLERLLLLILATTTANRRPTLLVSSSQARSAKLFVSSVQATDGPIRIPALPGSLPSPSSSSSSIKPSPTRSSAHPSPPLHGHTPLVADFPPSYPNVSPNVSHSLVSNPNHHAPSTATSSIPSLCWTGCQHREHFTTLRSLRSITTTTSDCLAE